MRLLGGRREASPEQESVRRAVRTLAASGHVVTERAAQGASRVRLPVSEQVDWSRVRLTDSELAAQRSARRGADGETIDYALELASVVRYVANEMEGAARSVSEMAAAYRHANGGDVIRVKKYNGLTTNAEVSTWLIETALHGLGNQVEENADGTWRLTCPFDDVTFEGRKVWRF